MEEGKGELKRRRLSAGHPQSAAALALALALLPACSREPAPPPAPAAASVVQADLAEIERRLAPGGGVRVVNLWAMWCRPCVEELPELAALDIAIRGQGIQLIGISLDLALPGADPSDIETRVRDFLRQRGVFYPNLLYTGSVPGLLEALDLPGPIPYTLVIGADGEVAWRHEGRTTRASIEAAIEEATDSARAAGTGGAAPVTTGASTPPRRRIHAT